MYQISDKLHAELMKLRDAARRHRDLFNTRTHGELTNVSLEAARVFDAEKQKMAHICDDCGADLTAEEHLPGCPRLPEPIESEGWLGQPDNEPPEYDGEPTMSFAERARDVVPR